MGKKAKKEIHHNTEESTSDFIKKIRERISKYSRNLEKPKKINELKLHQIKVKSNDSTNYNNTVEEQKKYYCSICFQNDLNSSEMIILKCNHKLCKYCYKKWIRIKNACPMCRTEIVKIKNQNYDKFSVANLTQDDLQGLRYMFGKSY